MKKCKECKKKFPSHLVQPYTGVTNGQSFCIDVCPLCALEIRNKQHGLNETKFQGEMANLLLHEAREFIKRGEA
jgi:ferredoxin